MKEIRGDAGFKRSPWDRDKNGRWDCNKFDSVQDADDADIDIQQCNGNLQDNLHCDECRQDGAEHYIRQYAPFGAWMNRSGFIIIVWLPQSIILYIMLS